MVSVINIHTTGEHDFEHRRHVVERQEFEIYFHLNGNTSNNNKPADGEGVFNNAMYGDWMPKRPAAWSTGLPRKGSVEAQLNNGFNNTESYRFQMNAV